MNIYYEVLKNTIVFYGLLAQLWYIFKFTDFFEKLKNKVKDNEITKFQLESYIFGVAIISLGLYKTVKIFPLIFVFYFLRGTFEVAHHLSSEFKAKHIKEIAVVISIISLIASAVLLR